MRSEPPSDPPGGSPQPSAGRVREQSGHSRRLVLAAASAAATGAIAGCFVGGSGPGRDAGEPGDGPGSDGTDADGDPNDATEGVVTPPELPERPFRHAEIVRFETGPRSVALPVYFYHPEPGVRVIVRFEAPATVDSPAVVRAGLFNRRSYTRTVELLGTPPFESRSGSIASEAQRAGRYFVPTEETPLARVEPQYQRGPEGYWRVSGTPRDWLPERVELDPQASVAGLFYLLGPPDRSGFPTGTYEFGREGRLVMTVWNTAEPGPSPDSRFDPGELPRLPLEERTVWYHETDPTTPRYLVPSHEHAEFPATISFELVNNSAAVLHGGGPNWALYKLVDGEWFVLSDRWRTMQRRTFSPGGRYEWTFLGFDEAAPEGVDGTVREYLGGGTYAFRARHSLDSEETYAAAFDLTGPPVAVVPSADVSTERDGSRVTVTAPRREGAGRGVVRVERVEDRGTGERLLPEQVMGQPDEGLRNAVSSFEPGVSVVELRTDGLAALDALDGAEDSRRFRFEGDAFEATLVSIGDE